MFYISGVTLILLFFNFLQFFYKEAINIKAVFAYFSHIVIVFFDRIVLNSTLLFMKQNFPILLFFNGRSGGHH